MANRTAIEWTDATWTPIRARNKATGKVGKKAAGRLLDGVTHDGFPEVAA